MDEPLWSRRLYASDRHYIANRCIAHILVPQDRRLALRWKDEISRNCGLSDATGRYQHFRWWIQSKAQGSSGELRELQEHLRAILECRPAMWRGKMLPASPKKPDSTRQRPPSLDARSSGHDASPAGQMHMQQAEDGNIFRSAIMPTHSYPVHFIIMSFAQIIFKGRSTSTKSHFICFLPPMCLDIIYCVSWVMI